MLYTVTSEKIGYLIVCFINKSIYINSFGIFFMNSNIMLFLCFQIRMHSIAGVPD